MSHLRRLTAALSGVLLLQLSLLGSGTLCALQHPAGHGGMDQPSSAMAGMQHDARGAAGAAGTEVLSSAPGSLAGGCDQQAAAGSCHGPWAAGTCASMGSCASSQSATIPPMLAWRGSAARATLSEPRSLHAAPAPAPELPPPRA